MPKFDLKFIAGSLYSISRSQFFEHSSWIECHSGKVIVYHIYFHHYILYVFLPESIYFSSFHDRREDSKACGSVLSGNLSEADISHPVIFFVTFLILVNSFFTTWLYLEELIFFSSVNRFQCSSNTSRRSRWDIRPPLISNNGDIDMRNHVFRAPGIEYCPRVESRVINFCW